MTGLTLRSDGTAAVIEIDNPPQNRFTRQMLRQFDDAITSIEQSDARVVLIRGVGADFSHGLDISAWPDFDANTLREYLNAFLTTFNRFERLPMPTVAAVTGTCTGGAYELALRADFVVASESARFGSTEASLGLVTGFGGIVRTAERAGRTFATDVAFNSTVFGAGTAMAHGLLSRVVPDDTLAEVVAELVDHLGTGPTAAYAANKAMLHHWSANGVSATEEVILDLSMPAITSSDANRAISSAVAALAAGRPRPRLRFEGK